MVFTQKLFPDLWRFSGDFQKAPEKKFSAPLTMLHFSAHPDKNSLLPTSVTVSTLLSIQAIYDYYYLYSCEINVGKLNNFNRLAEKQCSRLNEFIFS